MKREEEMRREEERRREEEVLITEPCSLSLERSEGSSQETISNHLQSLVESINQSASDVYQSFLLTQTQYLTLMHFFNDGSSDPDAVLIAKQLAEDDLSSEQLFLVEFLSTLTTSLQEAVGRVSVFILKMGMQGSELLLSILTHLNGKEISVTLDESQIQSLLSQLCKAVFDTKGWWPTVRQMLQWCALMLTEKSGVLQVVSIDTDQCVTAMFAASSLSRLFRIEEKNLSASHNMELLQNSLSKFDNEPVELTEIGQFINADHQPPEARKLNQKSKLIEAMREVGTKCIPLVINLIDNVHINHGSELPTVDEDIVDTFKLTILIIDTDQCVTAMSAAPQVSMGNKTNVLSSDVHSQEQTKEWSDFYKYFETSIKTNRKKTNAPYKEAYEADIVHGTMNDLVADFILHDIHVMEIMTVQFSRVCLIEGKNLLASHNMELSRLKDNNPLKFAAEVLQNLLSKFHSEPVELRRTFIEAIFQELNTNPNIDTNTGHKIITISKKKMNGNEHRILETEVGKVNIYKILTQLQKNNPGLGQFINADHQPPVSSILEARNLNPNSRLTEAMLEVGTKSSLVDNNLIKNVYDNHGRELPAVSVPEEIHQEFLSTRSQNFRSHLAKTISNDDVVGAFKLTILGSMPRFKFNNNFQEMSKTRVDVFERSFQQHSTKMVQTWFKLLQEKNVMTTAHFNTITEWINNKGYDNKDDPHRNEVSNLL